MAASLRSNVSRGPDGIVLDCRTVPWANYNVSDRLHQSGHNLCGHSFLIRQISQILICIDPSDCYVQPWPIYCSYNCCGQPFFFLVGRGGKCVMHRNVQGAVCGTPERPAVGPFRLLDILPPDLPTKTLLRRSARLHPVMRLRLFDLF